MAIGEFVAVLVMVTLPVKLPVVVGAKFTFNVADCSAPIV
jgi:hypothetical protein